MQQLSQLDAHQHPILLTGDFNSPAESLANCGDDDEPALPYHLFLRAGFIDAYRAIHVADDQLENTFHGFKGNEFSIDADLSRWRIDWILISAGARSISIQGCKIVRHATPLLYPSDHYPVIADLRIV